MIRNIGIFCFILSTAFVAAMSPAHANSKLVQGKKFMSLASARTGAPSTATRPSQVQRSDMKSLRSGFMRLDRELVINATRRTNVVRATTAAPEAVALLKPNDAPVITRGSAVTDLFGDNDGADAPVFGETMRGATPAHRSGHIWPIASSVPQKFTSGYGMRKDPFHGRQAFHGGIDIAAATGTPILASAAGKISDVGTGRGYGQYVTIQHTDGTETRYSHLSAQSVREGQQVRQGQVIGKLGSTGRSTGPHLDYRIKKNDQRIDPMLVLNAPQGTATKVAQVVRVR
jgi:murein DD-endopeptidase MepM/ murein hydrolase activator NlpD